MPLDSASIHPYEDVEIGSVPAIPRRLEGDPNVVIIPGGKSDLVAELVAPELPKLVRSGYAANTKFLFINQPEDGFHSDEDFRKYLKPHTKDEHREAKPLMERVFSLNCKDLTSPADLEALFTKSKLESAIGDIFDRRWMMHTALPPQVWLKMLEHMPDIKNLSNIMLEKPVGTNVSEAERIIKALEETAYSDRLRATDHYLAKDIVRRILMLRQGRAADGEFENGWTEILNQALDPENWRYVDIVMDEKLGLGPKEEGENGRGKFFESVGGIVPDMMGHMAQVVAAIEAATSKDTSDKQVLLHLNTIKNQKTKALGQYIGYLDHPDVPKNSKVPTGIVGSFDTEAPSGKLIRHDFRMAKGVKTKRGRITIELKGYITDERTQERVTSVEIRINSNEVILHKHRADGQDMSEQIAITPQGGPDFLAYGNLYADAIGGGDTGTVDLGNVIAAHKAVKTFRQSRRPLQKYSQGVIWDGQKQ